MRLIRCLKSIPSILSNIPSGVLISTGASNTKPRTKRGFVFDMARPERFELPTPWFEAKCSIQLSYGRVTFLPLSLALSHKGRGNRN